jgi:hypothetical protein
MLAERDMDSICLKCLQKEPRRRYVSAAALAEDLCRFQGGETILARPVGRAEKLVRWGRRNPALAGLLGLSVLTVALVAILVGVAWKPGSAPPREVAAPVKKIQVSMELSQHRGEKAKPLGKIGDTSFAVQFDDDVRVHAGLSSRAYCYLLAFNPDGKVQLCHPRDETAPPERISTLEYPLNPAKFFSLTDGSGLQAFVLVASREPLPSYKEWRAANGGPPWRQTQADGIWRFDGHRYEAMGPQRGQERERQGPPQVLQALCNFFKDRPQVDAIEVLAFPVQPKDGKESPNPDEGK